VCPQRCAKKKCDGKLLKAGGPRRDRTGDLLIANEREGESEQVSEGLSGPQEGKEDEDETG
jgi:hypothetical protein